MTQGGINVPVLLASEVMRRMRCDVTMQRCDNATICRDNHYALYTRPFPVPMRSSTLSPKTRRGYFRNT
jgi:hypothetical protein